MKKKRMGRKSLKIKWFRKKITKKDISSSIYKSGIIYLFGHAVIRNRNYEKTRRFRTTRM